MHSDQPKNPRTLEFPESVLWWSLALAVFGALFGWLTTGEDGQRFMASRAIAFSGLFVMLEGIALPLRWALEKLRTPAWLQWVVSMAVLIGFFRTGAAWINHETIGEALLAGLITGAITGAVIHHVRRRKAVGSRKTSRTASSVETQNPASTSALLDAEDPDADRAV